MRERLRALGAEEIPQFASNYLIRGDLGGRQYTLLLNVSVDDLTLCGPTCCDKSFWQALKQTVKLEPEATIDASAGTLILGRKHYKQKKDLFACST